MKKISISQFIILALLLAGALNVPVSIKAMEQEQALKPQKQNLVRRLVADFKETRALYQKRKAGKASPEELKTLEARMQKIRKAAVAAGVIVAFIAATVGTAWWLKGQGQRVIDAYRDEYGVLSGDRLTDTSLLKVAVVRGRFDVAQALLNKGVDINYEGTHKKETALHAAARASEPEAVAWLLDRGAKVNAQNTEGLTPLDMADKNKDAFTWFVLHKRGAKTGEELREEERE